MESRHSSTSRLQSCSEVVFQFYKALTRAVFAPAHTVKVASDICQLRYARKRIESCKEVEQAPANNSINIRQAFNELGASNAFIGVGVTGVSWDPKATVMSWLDHNTFLTTTTCSRHRPCPPRWDSYLRHSGLKVAAWWRSGGDDEAGHNYWVNGKTQKILLSHLVAFSGATGLSHSAYQRGACIKVSLPKVFRSLQECMGSEQNLGWNPFITSTVPTFSYLFSFTTVSVRAGSCKEQYFFSPENSLGLMRKHWLNAGSGSRLCFAR